MPKPSPAGVPWTHLSPFILRTAGTDGPCLAILASHQKSTIINRKSSIRNLFLRDPHAIHPFHIPPHRRRVRRSPVFALLRRDKQNDATYLSSPGLSFSSEDNSCQCQSRNSIQFQLFSFQRFSIFSPAFTIVPAGTSAPGPMNAHAAIQHPSPITPLLLPGHRPASSPKHIVPLPRWHPVRCPPRR
jgi:hypothetical protein